MSSLQKHILLMLALSVAAFSHVTAQSRFWQEMNKGKKNFERGNYAKAIQHYENAVDLDSVNMRAHYSLGSAALYCDSINLALREFEKVAKGSNDNQLKSYAHHNSGVVYQTQAGFDERQDVKQEHLKMAIAQYRQSLRYNPQSDPTRYNLALCMKQLKDLEKQRPQEQPKPQEQKKEEKPQQSQKNPKQNPPDNQPPPPQQQDRQMLEYARRKEEQTRQRMQSSKAYAQPKSKNW